MSLFFICEKNLTVSSSGLSCEEKKRHCAASLTLRSVGGQPKCPSPSDRFCGRKGVEQEGSAFFSLLLPHPAFRSMKAQERTEGRQTDPQQTAHRKHCVKPQVSPRSPKPAEALRARGQTAAEGPSTVLTPAKYISREDTEIGKQFLSLLDLILAQGIVLRPGT